MTDLFDPTGDFAQIIDGASAITLQRPGSSQSLAIAAALRLPITTAEAAASEGKYTAADVEWLFAPPDDLPEDSIAPQVGDRLVEGDGASWTIISVLLEVAGSRWRCHARRLAIDDGPTEIVTIQRAVWEKGVAGALWPAWSDLHAGVRARIQPIAAALADRRDRREMAVTHHVFLAEPLAAPLELVESDRIVALDGRTYLVVGFERPERIDQLLVAHVVLQSEAP